MIGHVLTLRRASKNILKNKIPRRRGRHLIGCAHVDTSRRDHLTDIPSLFTEGSLFAASPRRSLSRRAPHVDTPLSARRIARVVRNEPVRIAHVPSGLDTTSAHRTHAVIAESSAVEWPEGKIFEPFRAAAQVDAAATDRTPMKVTGDIPRAFGMSPPRVRLQTPGTPDLPRDAWGDRGHTTSESLRPFDVKPPADHSASSLGFDLLFDTLEETAGDFERNGPMPMLMEEDSCTSSDDGHDRHAVYVRCAPAPSPRLPSVFVPKTRPLGRYSRIPPSTRCGARLRSSDPFL